MSEIKLTIHPFKMDTLKEAAKKVQEEAGEVFAEYVILQEQKDRGTTSLADEIADTIQASCNLAARYGIDLQAAMERCERRNKARGRYPMEEKHVESCGIRDGHDCADAPVGVDNLPKLPEDMSAEELIKAICLTNGYGYIIDEHGFLRGGSCKETLGDDWCDSYYSCRDCRNRLLDLLKEAYKQEKKDVHFEDFRLCSEIGRRDKEIDRLKREIKDLTHERDGMKRRLAELDSAGITSLHRLLREAMGEAKNITHNARVYIDKQKGSNNELCGSDSGRDSCVCGAERAGEHLLSEEPPAQEISEREKVLERLRGYDVYMAEPPSKNANRLFACITGNNDAEIACGNDIEDVRDKLIELIGEGGAE